MGHTAHLFMIIGSCSILSEIFKYETLLKQMYYKTLIYSNWYYIKQCYKRTLLFGHQFLRSTKYQLSNEYPSPNVLKLTQLFIEPLNNYIKCHCNLDMSI